MRARRKEIRPLNFSIIIPVWGNIPHIVYIFKDDYGQKNFSTFFFFQRPCCHVEALFVSIKAWSFFTVCVLAACSFSLVLCACARMCVFVRACPNVVLIKNMLPIYIYIYIYIHSVNIFIFSDKTGVSRFCGLCNIESTGHAYLK
jgi:hypothetical protein